MNSRWLTVAALSIGIGAAQTRLDLGRQGRSADFSGFTLTRPFQTGTQLPQSCVTGQTYFKSDNQAGRNLFGCTSLGSWVEMAGASGGVNIGTGVSLFAGINTGVLQFRKLDSLSPRISITVNEAQQKLDFDVSQSGFDLANLGGQLSANQLASRNGNGSSVQMFGGGPYAASDCVQFDTDGNIVSAGGPCGGLGITAGTGLTQSGGQVSLDTALVPYAERISGVLSDWSEGADEIPGQSCVEQTLDAPGTSAGEAVAPHWPAALPASLTGVMRISEPGKLAVRLCNPTLAAVALPDGVIWGATVVRSFQ